ncbi:hypothetical protein BSY16_6096 (plasmid) [Sinorhizobium sp. RAC02]|nr:hypothetical protein BSY16_6096 [Sinorhizobium sp. RAC02]
MMVLCHGIAKFLGFATSQKSPASDPLLPARVLDGFARNFPLVQLTKAADLEPA